MIEFDRSQTRRTHARNCARSIFHLLGHVDGTVDALSNSYQQRQPNYHTLIRATDNKSSRGSHLAHNTSASHRRPASEILELAKNIADRSSRSEDPERDDDDEEADEEHDEDDAFEVQAEFPRETLSAISVRRKMLSFPATMASERILDRSYPPSTRLPSTKGSAEPMCKPYDIEGM